MFQKYFGAYFSSNYENVFQCFLTLFFVLSSHFHVEMFSVTNSYKVLVFKAETIMEISIHH